MSAAKRSSKGRFVSVPDAAVGDGSGSGEVVGDVAKPDIAAEPATVNPDSIDGSADTIGDDHHGDDLSVAEQPRRGRGRPRGSGTKAKTGAYPLNVRGLEKLLVGIHGGIAVLASSPSFALDTAQKVFDGKTEAEFLSQSVADVARHYNPTVFEQKAVDWANLIQCVAMVYGPRIYNMRSERKAAKARDAARAPQRFAPPTARPVDPSPRVNDAARNGAPTDRDIRTGHVPGIGDIEVPPEFMKVN